MCGCLCGGVAVRINANVCALHADQVQLNTLYVHERKRQIGRRKTKKKNQKKKRAIITRSPDALNSATVLSQNTVIDIPNTSDESNGTSLFTIYRYRTWYPFLLINTLTSNCWYRISAADLKDGNGSTLSFQTLNPLVQPFLLHRNNISAHTLSSPHHCAQAVGEILFIVLPVYPLLLCKSACHQRAPCSVERDTCTYWRHER
jgi:hypothetical protein